MLERISRNTVTRNYAEKSINSILNRVSKGVTEGGGAHGGAASSSSSAMADAPAPAASTAAAAAAALSERELTQNNGVPPL